MKKARLFYTESYNVCVRTMDGEEKVFSNARQAEGWAASNGIMTVWMAAEDTTDDLVVKAQNSKSIYNWG